ncbi:hypothetical protein [Micromonospora sp. NPDC049891]|uniref:hypothetical protein n=1 Tax=Micromonospora sp. NPDC049891 TaxID=3155655 RepID=UPI0033D674BC
MRSVSVSAPDGIRWTVRVVWEPRWRALARRFGGWRRKRDRDRGIGDVVDGTLQVGDAATPGSNRGGAGGGFDLEDVVFVLVVVFFAVIITAVVFWWVLLPLLLVVIDLVVVLVLLVSAVLGRVLFRRPWTVQATAAHGERIVAQVVGWRAALRRRDEMAESLARGTARTSDEPDRRGTVTGLLDT